MLDNVISGDAARGRDKVWWQLTSKGSFSVQSAWDYVRAKGIKWQLAKFIWVKGLPIKISFIIWRAWKFKLSLEEELKCGNFGR